MEKPTCLEATTTTTSSNNNNSNNQRRLSLPDLTKLKEEWDRREAVQATAQLLPGKLQVKTPNSIFPRKIALRLTLTFW
jgi:hypothetical protein